MNPNRSSQDVFTNVKLPEQTRLTALHRKDTFLRLTSNGAKLPISLLSLGILALARLAPIGVDADTIVNGDINSDTGWTTTGSPYILSGPHNVSSGVTLTIDQGVVVKFDKTATIPYNGYADMVVSGNIVAEGTAINPIYFTSLADDSVGGDSNADGSVTTPAPGDWQGINFVPGSNATFDHTVIRYAASNTHGAALLNVGGNVSISNSVISQNKRYGLYQGLGTSTIDHSLFSDEDTGVHQEGSAIIITNSQFSNTVTGIFTHVMPGVVDFENNIFSGNQEATEIALGQATITHSGNIFTNNKFNGIFLTGEPAGDLIINNTSDGPYIAGFSVKAGTTVTLGPGVALKFPPNGFLNVSGKLVASGTPENKIYFSSLKDDGAGGDTNGDGGVTSPAPLDWGRIAVASTGELDLNSAVVRYGGYGDGNGGIEGFRSEVSSVGGPINIANSEISDSPGVGIVNSAGFFNISSSTIERNYEGINSYQNGAGTIAGSRIVNNKNRGVINQSNTGIVIDARNNWWGDTTGPSDPIRKPSGLGGSIGGDVNYTPWLTSDPYIVATTTVTGITKPVIIIPGIMGSAEKDGQMVIDPILHVYDDFVATFEANGYVQDKTIFTFPYDWRNSNVNSAQSLRLKINQVKSICGCGKVDIVAHSMGGLVARQYIESPAYQNDVDKIVFIGVPQKGAPEDYLYWEGAIAGPFSFQSALMLRMIEQEGIHNGYPNLFNYIHSRPIPSLQELLPIYSYKIDQSNNFSFQVYPSAQYPQNTFLENLESNKGILNNFPILNIVGDIATSTIREIVVKDSNELPKWEHGKPVNFNSGTGLYYDNGDGTVPFESATEFPGDQQVILNQYHLDLVDNSSTSTYKFLTGNEAQTVINNQNNFNLESLKYVFVRLFSPIDMVVVAPDGKRIGKDFTNGQEINEIPGAFYSGFNTDNEYIVIPNPIDGQYKVQTVGTGSGGQYTVAVSELSNSNVSDTKFTGTTLPDLQESVSFNVNSATTSPLVITSDDKEPPKVYIDSPTQGNYDHSQTINVTATSTDNIDVATSTLLFGGRLIANNSVVDLFFEKLGTTTITATATDFQNNQATASLDIQVVATASSTVSDIERAYTLGWITKKNIKDELIQKLQRVLKAQKRIDTIVQKVNGKNVSKKVERVEMVIDRVLGRALLLDLKGYTRDKINIQAYNVIKADLEWLVNN